MPVIDDVNFSKLLKVEAIEGADEDPDSHTIYYVSRGKFSMAYGRFG